MTIFIAGNSHVGALAQAARLDTAFPANVQIFAFGSGAVEPTPFSAISDGKVVMVNPDYADRVSRYTGSAALEGEHVWVLMMGTHTTRLFAGGFWKQAVPPSLPGLVGRPVSQALMETIIDDDQRHVLEFVASLKSVGERVIVASCPPIRRDGAVMNAGNPTSVVREVHSRACARFTEALNEIGVSFVSPPPETADEEGFLLPEFSVNMTNSGKMDPHHANERYGELMLPRVLSAVRREFPDALLD